MQDLENPNQLEELLRKFNDLKDENEIRDFWNSDEGTSLFSALSRSPRYSDLKEFERIIPLYIDVKISESLKGVSTPEDLEKKDLGLKTLLGDDENILGTEKKLKDKIVSKMIGGQSAQDSFNLVKESRWWHRILELLSSFISLNSQIKNATSKFVQQKLQETKGKLVSDINDFDKKFQQNSEGAEVSRSANPVGVFEKDGKKVFIKDMPGIMKGLFYHAVTDVKNDGIRELFGAEFMRAMGINNASQIELIADGNTPRKIVSPMVGKEGDSVESLGKTLGAPDGLKKLTPKQREEVEAEAKKFFEDNPGLKGKVMGFNCISYLMGNRDLHVNNVMVITDQETKQKSVAPIDFGLSGHDMKVLDSWYYTNRFDTANLHHSDAKILFSQDEYKEVFKKVLDDFNKRKEDILDKVLYQCKAAGASDKEISALRANVEANVARATQEVLSPESLKQKQQQTQNLSIKQQLVR